jgi:hypothetical protein
MSLRTRVRQYARASFARTRPGMTNDPVPDDLRAFILRHIDSIAELEALLLMRRERRAWSGADVAARLYIPASAAALVLDRLCAAALVARNGSEFGYAPASEELGQMVDRLADTYARSLIPVTAIVHGKTRVQQFADAFRFKRDPK